MGCLVISGGKVVTASWIIEAEILVEDGVVSEIARSVTRRDCRRLDAGGMLVMPGAVDEHVHFREPGYEYKEDFETGSMQAAAGGVTTVADMPNTKPPTDSPEKIREKAQLASSKSHVDFAIYAALHDGNADRIESLLSAGAIGLKVYMGETTGELPSPSDAAILKALELSAEKEFPLVFHAENGSLLELYKSRARSGERKDTRLWSEARPPICEEEAVSRVALLAKETGGTAHIAHVSSEEAIAIVADAASRGVRITAEATPHHLLLDLDDYERHGNLVKVNPPIRGGRHREALRWALSSGIIATLASDHAPHAEHEKRVGSVWEASSGIPGVQTLLPLALDMALRGEITLTRLAELVSENPARILGLYPRKGALLPGSDADIVVVDPKGEWEIKREHLYLKHDVSPYVGWRLKGRIRYTILRGETIAENGVVVERKPRGKWLRRGALRQSRQG